jgi:hypothetical protein
VSYHYSNPERENEKFALPDVETFEIAEGSTEHLDDDGEPLSAGWYYWFCFPGCMPDSEPSGPYDTEEAAIAAAREGCE